MKKIGLLILVSMLMLPAMAVMPVATQPRIAGVDVGDWFKYSGFDVNWSSDDPDATVPSHVKEMNETEWMKVTIVSVIGTNVTAQIVVHFKNGTEDVGDFSIDVDTGDAKGFTPIYAPISAGLSVNDTVWSSEYYSDWRIDETVVRTYPDGVRETNCVNITKVDDIPWDYSTVIFYWDRPTGIPVEVFYEHEKFGEEYMSYSVRITASNVWIIPEFPTWTSMLLVLIVLAVAIAIYKRRQLKTPIH